ncbi:helix-turn-helix domain-containing protein [Candidatus Poriferisodalis sp.]|uniref:helix-turn-helix domain-containing protein n=1 Tax=Candidatus Poriferisodalis sp. TaxID=3101277 RepID=UPI003D10A831
MAARLSLDERVFIESSLGAGRSVADAAARLGRDPSAVHRELARCGVRAMTPARRTRGRARGRDAFGSPSWRSIGCWPLRSMSA